MAKKSLGQHFLYNPQIIRRIVESARLEPGDLVVEIGPGYGTMTKIIAEKVAKVIAIELDEELYKKIQKELSIYENINVVYGDALEYPFNKLPPFKVVANIPYYITTPIIFRLLEIKSEKGEFLHNLKSITISIQKEVAERIIAKPGGKDYGILSIMVQYYAKPSFEFIIPREAFRPIPKVDSAVIQMQILEKPAVNVLNEKRFFKIIRTAFSQRRKMLSNSLKALYENPGQLLLNAGIDPHRRPETLTIEEFARLANL
jgi:16S rRNA (adenine1518-N6/adenine1519-N6)-dimethyltransferase